MEVLSVFQAVYSIFSIYNEFCNRYSKTEVPLPECKENAMMIITTKNNVSKSDFQEADKLKKHTIVTLNAV